MSARWIDAKGAPESILPRCGTAIWRDGDESVLGAEERAEIARRTDDYAGNGLRVLAVAQRHLESEAPTPSRREHAERDLCFLGLVAMFDPPRV